MLQRILILLLCTVLVSGSCFNKYKISARATTIATGLSAYTLYEICAYIGTLLLTGLSVKFVVDNRDQIAEIGKDFIDSSDISELSGWILSKVDTTGSSYVYGTEALQEVKDTTFEVIQGGGNAPKNDDDNDKDGDVDFDDRTVELQNMGMWVTGAFNAWLCGQLEILINKIDAGEETFLSEHIPKYSYTGELETDSDGNYLYSLYAYGYNDFFKANQYKYFENSAASERVCATYIPETKRLCFFKPLITDTGKLSYTNKAFEFTIEVTVDGVLNQNTSITNNINIVDYYSCNFPVFVNPEEGEVLNYLHYGIYSGCDNLAKNYRIADWLQEDWKGCVEAVNSGVRSLYDNMLIVGAAANQALQNQSNGLGYIEDLLARLAAALALPLPDTISDPVYYPDPSEDPELEELPWEDPEPEPDPDPDEPAEPEPDPEPEPDEDLDIQNYAVDLRQIFPFCIPFDFIALLEVLEAEPVAPKFEYPFVIPSLNINETLVLDLSFLDEEMAIVRKLELISFIIGLMFLTGKVIKW